MQPKPSQPNQLRPYQIEGVEKLIDLAGRRGGAILADEPGLGKTIQERFSPAGGQPTRNGYLNWNGAVKYTGLSKSTLQRAVNSGELKAPHKLTKARNGAVVFEIAELDKYIRAH